MSKRKKRATAPSSNLDRLKSRARKTFKDMQVISRVEGEKMSEVILSLIAPFNDLVDSRQAFERLVVLAIAAWNASILEEPDRGDLIKAIRKNILSQAGSQHGKDFDAIISALMHRKEHDFADNKRLILDYSISETKAEYRVAVVSTPERH